MGKSICISTALNYGDFLLTTIKL